MPSQWAPVYQSVWTHRKTFELAALLGVNETYAAAHLIRLWTWAIDNAPDGDLSGLSERAIAYGAGWQHEVSLFVGALLKAGFLDPDHTIHDWADYAGKILERRLADAERKQKSRGHTLDVPWTSNGASAPVRRREDKSTEEKRREEETTVSSPQPPPPEGEYPPTPRKRGAANGEAQPAPAAPEVAAALTATDRTLWASAVADASQYMSPPNAEMLTTWLVPVGRGKAGELLLRAPPGTRVERFRGTLARSLADLGDPHAAQLQIFEG